MITITIETGNDAFGTPGEVGRILRGIADNLDTLPRVACGGRLRDTHGNTCGRYDYTPEPEPEPEPEPRRYIIEQEADGGYDSVEVCEFRIIPCGRVEVASFGGWESTLLTAAEPLDLEALARDVADEAANGDREIYDPDKDVRVTPVT